MSRSTANAAPSRAKATARFRPSWRRWACRRASWITTNTRSAPARTRAAASYIEVRVGDASTGFGVGVDRDIVTASFQAVLCAINRHLKANAATPSAAPAEAITA